MTSDSNYFNVREQGFYPPRARNRTSYPHETLPAWVGAEIPPFCLATVEGSQVITTLLIIAFTSPQGAVVKALVLHVREARFDSQQ